MVGCSLREAFLVGVVPIALSCVGVHVPLLLQSAYQEVWAVLWDPTCFCAGVSSSWICSNSTFHCEVGMAQGDVRIITFWPPASTFQWNKTKVCSSLWELGEGFPLETFSCFDTSVFSLLLEVGQTYTPLGHRDHTCIVNSKLGSVVGLLEGAGHAGFQSMKSAQHQKRKWQNFYVYEQVLVFGSFLPFYEEISTCYKWGILTILCFPDNERFRYLGVNRLNVRHC